MSVFDRDIRVNIDRLKRRFEAVRAFGATPDGGLNRPSFSSDDLAARAWLV